VTDCGADDSIHVLLLVSLRGAAKRAPNTSGGPHHPAPRWTWHGPRDRMVECNDVVSEQQVFPVVGASNLHAGAYWPAERSYNTRPGTVPRIVDCFFLCFFGKWATLPSSIVFHVFGRPTTSHQAASEGVKAGLP